MVTFHTESTFCPDFRLYAIISFTKSVNDSFNPINDHGSVIRRLIRRNHVRIFLDSKIDVIGSFQGKTLRVLIYTIVKNQVVVSFVGKDGDIV